MRKVKGITIMVLTDSKEMTIESYLQAYEQALKAEQRKRQRAMQFINKKGLMKEFKNLTKPYIK